MASYTNNVQHLRYALIHTHKGNYCSLFIVMAGCVPFLAAGQTLPLQSRVARSRSKVAVHVPFTQRLPTYGGYSEVNMERAYEAVASGRMSIRKAAEEHGVPRSTLHDRVSGKVALKARSGAKRHLTDEEETQLVDFLVGCASVGYAKSRMDVLAIAQQIVSARNPNVEVTKGWWDSFRSRHPEIVLRQAEPLSYARAASNNPEVIDKYFDLLEDTLKVNGLTQCPGQLFNCDEIGMPLLHKPPKVCHAWDRSILTPLPLVTNRTSPFWHVQVPPAILSPQWSSLTESTFSRK